MTKRNDPGVIVLHALYEMEMKSYKIYCLAQESLTAVWMGETKKGKRLNRNLQRQIRAMSKIQRIAINNLQTLRIQVKPTDEQQL